MKRNPLHSKIVQALCEQLSTKEVARKFKISVGEVQGIADRWTETIRVPKDDPGEGQLSFLHHWKNLKPFKRPYSD